MTLYMALHEALFTCNMVSLTKESCIAGYRIWISKYAAGIHTLYYPLAVAWAGCILTIFTANTSDWPEDIPLYHPAVLLLTDAIQRCDLNDCSLVLNEGVYSQDFVGVFGLQHLWPGTESVLNLRGFLIRNFVHCNFHNGAHTVWFSNWTRSCILTNFCTI